ncbi:MAG: ferrous iron transporter B [Ottowia sp.]|nr:ferrous iron transporter B [Ottowia sp.]
MSATSCTALLGAPNCGKTALFNGLTGANARVANYPGVTVEHRQGTLVGAPSIMVVDLPGAYSLRTASPDEAVARDVALGRLGQRPDAIIAVADATNLRMTLRMVLELKELGLPMVVALNLSDVAKARGLQIDVPRLSELLGVPTLETVAINRASVQKLREAVLALPREGAATPPDAAEVEQRLAALDSSALYAQVDDILEKTVSHAMELPAWHRKLDALTLHPVWGCVLLVLVLGVMFQSIYTWAEPLMDLIEDTFEWLGGWVEGAMAEGVLRDLIIEGLIGGVGAVLVFLPQIVILFAFILLLEDSGYLPRAALLLDRLLAHLGLSGRAFIPLLSSFACAVPAIMAARTIRDPRERMATIAVSPMLTCSARLPVYALLIAAIIPERTVLGFLNLQGLTLLALYLAGIAWAALAAWVLKVWARRKGHMQQFPLLMELPAWRWPNWRHFALGLWERVRAFLVRAGTIIFAMTVVIWALVSFPGEGINESYAGQIGRLFQPLFAPLGFTWEMCIALIPGMAAREVVVAALGTVYAVGAETEEALEGALTAVVQERWGLAVAFSFLAWYVLAPMCIAMLATIKREMNSWRHTAIITGALFALAYVFAFIVYRIAL